jgi:predicted MFS family arabinose efflux permease
MENKLSLNQQGEDNPKLNQNKQVSQKVFDPKQVGVFYSLQTRWRIFVILMIINLFINMDHGTIPAATNEIKDDLNITNDTLGIFGSLVYLGSLIGSMVFFTIIGTFNRKWVIVSCMVLISASLYTFTKFKLLYFLFINRTVTGFFQVK